MIKNKTETLFGLYKLSPLLYILCFSGRVILPPHSVGALVLPLKQPKSASERNNK